ncbi:hypothetical protein PP2015_1984 [Pseudoalteromonas phenolica]|uniref:Uncharacterized protein n=1 Tax=Pseudoalteromonas phenolica TaxID=161398 RepID=A0A0S2K3F3_9GAMM|nr:hypothetical protein PP2015_1984 [Pseudoalteromonas phenolica]
MLLFFYTLLEYKLLYSLFIFSAKDVSLKVFHFFPFQQLFAGVLTLLFLSGCNTIHANKNAILQIEQGQFKQAKQTIKQNYSPVGRDRLLHELELASILHLEREYLQSNQHLENAKSQIASFYTISLSEQALAMLSGPTFSTYEGKNYYLPLIHYLKALNFNALAQENLSMRKTYLDSSQVEMRQLDVYMENLKSETGGYNKPQKKDDESLTSIIYDILKPITAPDGLLENIEYKDDAFAHLFSGFLNEQNNDFDAARLQYQRAAHAYGNGFAKQYGLANTTEKLAIQNLARSMKLAGGYQSELQVLLDKHTSLEVPKGAQLTIIQNLGIAPEKKQLNFMLRAEARSKALVMYPIFIGTEKEKREQRLWFQMLYADTSLFDLMQNYILGDVSDVLLGTMTKRIPLGSLWDEAEDIGLIDALEYGGRISVSYLAPPKLPIRKTEVWQDNKKLADLEQFHSISQLALQKALIDAQSEIRVAFTREIVKALSARKAMQVAGTNQNNLLGSFVKMASTAVNAITASADTRQWQSLPAQIRLAQLSLKPGLQNLTIKTTLNSGRVIQQSANIDVQGSMTVWHTRTFLNASPAVNAL